VRMAAKVKKAVVEGLGEHAKTLDAPIIDYIVGILTDYSGTDGETLAESIGPLLSDSGVDEGEMQAICERISRLLFGSKGRSQAQEQRSEPPGLKLLDAPVNMSGNGDKSIEAEMSLFVYAPMITRGARARGEMGTAFKPPKHINEYIDRSDEARIKREKRESKNRIKEEKIRKRKELENVRRDAAVITPYRRSEHNKNLLKDLRLHKFDIALASKVLIQDADLTLLSGRRYGLVGRNGAGKTTLLRHIAGRELSGIPDHIQILHVEQEAVGDDTTVLESVLQADIERAALLKEEKELLRVLKTDSSGASKMASSAAVPSTSGSNPGPSTAPNPEQKGGDLRLTQIYQRLEEIEADTAEARASAILAGLGFPPASQGRPTKEFSGGWRMRMALSRALFCQPDLLLLDEPTNMLDIGAVIWLENYLRTWKHTLLIVSHDRNFLNAVATDIIHLTNEKKLETYRGDYDAFERTRMERLKNMQKSREAQDKMRAHTQRFIDRFRYNAKRASLVQSRIKMLKKMEVIPALIEDPTISFSFPDPEELSPPLIQFDDVSFAYPAKSGLNAGGQLRNVFDKINFDLDMESRVALVGANGQGKTTLLKLITGELGATGGNLFIHRRIRFATFSQHHVDQLNMDVSPLQFFQQNWPGKDAQEYRTHLGRYGISGDLALQSIHTLSGGQKSRVVFALMGWIKPHFLILDEPTNHLDVETVDVLSKALNEFSGGIVLVSHDERLITSVCNELWVVHEGKVTPFEGDFDAYKSTILSEFRA
jgi:ATP-binding cassette subfamily F protein 3